MDKGKARIFILFMNFTTLQFQTHLIRRYGQGKGLVENCVALSVLYSL